MPKPNRSPRPNDKLVEPLFAALDEDSASQPEPQSESQPQSTGEPKAKLLLPWLVAFLAAACLMAALILS